MRGVVTAGMVTGLEMLGLRDVFDVVYGSSGGSSNGAFFLSGQAAYGTTIYYDRINNHNCVDLFGPLKGRPIVDLHYACDEVLTKIVVLDWHQVVHSAISLKVIASSVQDGGIDILDNFRSQRDLLNALHASARMPLVAGRYPFEYRDRLYWDSGILDPFAINTALADGCTHVLVLRGRPRGFAGSRLTLIERFVVAPHIQVDPIIRTAVRLK